MPSAPRLNLGSSVPAVAPNDSANATVKESIPDTLQDVARMDSRQVQAAWMRMVRHVMAHTEDVGSRFPEEARRIHHGEVPERAIRGQASRQETEALLDEGIGIVPLPVPAGLKEPLQ